MKKLLFISTLSAFSFLSQAGYNQAPPNFSYKDGKAVFVDFTTAKYEITFDSASKLAEVETTIQFKSNAHGYPIFDLIPNPSEVVLDGETVTTETTQDPDKQTTLRIVQRAITSGVHELRMKHVISANVSWPNEGVASGFWTSDLNDRRYLEQYLPTNLEYDQYQMHMAVEVKDARPHLLKANGDVIQTGMNTFEVTFPAFYTASSAYFHLMPEALLPENVQFYYRSLDGRMIPVDIYTVMKNLTAFAESTRTILAELERDYGPFPHNKIVIYGNSPSGGMEYSGATITSLSALAHELFHSYHARALMPANGNAGWMDEAIARWRDNKYPLTGKLNFESTRLAGHSIWSRMTDRMAYTEGSAFLSWIAFRMNEKGLSFKTFLRDYFQKYKYKTVTTELFKQEMSLAAGMDLTQEFNKYIYGKSSSLETMKSKKHVHIEEDPFHPQWTPEELQSLTLGKRF